MGALTACLCSQGPNVMEEQDLREIGISDPQHRWKLLQAARSLPKVTITISQAVCGPGAHPPPRAQQSSSGT